MLNEAKRPWLSFDLRTVFALVTIVCFAAAWLTVEFSWIKQRREARTQIEAKGIGTRIQTPSWRMPAGRAPGFLWLFGEPGGETFLLFKDLAGEDDIARMRGLFPEANFEITPSNSWGPTVRARLRQKRQDWLDQQAKRR